MRLPFSGKRPALIDSKCLVGDRLPLGRSGLHVRGDWSSRGPRVGYGVTANFWLGAHSSARHKEKGARFPATRALLSASRDTGEPQTESKEAPCSGGNSQPTIWFEAEDFLRYFDHFRNPTGTQRLSFEIYGAVNLLYGGSERVKFCRLSVFTKRLHAIRFEDLRSAFLNPLGATAPWKTFWEPTMFWERFPRSIPVVLQNPRFFLSIFKVAVRDLLETLTGRTSFDRQLRRGDMIVSLGAGWGIPGYMKHMAETKRRHGIKFSIFVHDVLPINCQVRLAIAAHQGVGAGLGLYRSAAGSRPSNGKPSGTLRLVRFND